MAPSVHTSSSSFSSSSSSSSSAKTCTLRTRDRGYMLFRQLLEGGIWRTSSISIDPAVQCGGEYLFSSPITCTCGRGLILRSPSTRARDLLPAGETPGRQNQEPPHETQSPAMPPGPFIPDCSSPHVLEHEAWRWRVINL